MYEVLPPTNLSSLQSAEVEKGEKKTQRLRKKKKLTRLSARKDSTFNRFHSKQLSSICKKKKRTIFTNKIQHTDTSWLQNQIRRFVLQVISAILILNEFTLILGFCSLKYFPEPVNVPPVPTPETRASTFPFEPFQISGPVVS